jgi:histidinol-phosphatase
MASRELAAAIEAAQAAAGLIRSLYRQPLAVRLKADASPVTEADERAEELIRTILHRHFPSYGFYGEEGGAYEMGAESLWLVDPIDGTKSFVRDTPFFATQIALMRAGKLVLGVSSAPAYQEFAWAEAGAGAFLNDERVRVSTVAELKAAFLSTGNLKALTADARWGRLGSLIGEVSRIRGYGDFVHYHLLARGALEGVIETNVNILDIAALAVIVREAGGTFTDLEGAPVGLNTTSVLASNGALHAALLAALTP